MRIRTLAGILFLAFFSSMARAETNYHLVGWLNTIVPGGGELLLGDSELAATQAGIEIGTFAYGFSLSAKSPMTLDGVPEQVPDRGTTPEPADISVQLKADLFQEIGIKYHMINVFDAYRKSHVNPEAGQGIDRSEINELFAAPFQADALEDPWVYTAILASLAFHAYSYSTETVTPKAPLNSQSNDEYAAMYAGVYPVGSAAPEEMFYRGFLQNEFYELTQTAFLSVPLSTLAFMYSHANDSYVGAGAMGLYNGFLVRKEKGKLKKAIAVHFWSDVIMGLHAIATINRNESATTTYNASSSHTIFRWDITFP